MPRSNQSWDRCVDLFDARRDDPDECWFWDGQTDVAGFPRVSFAGRWFTVPRVMWALANSDLGVDGDRNWGVKVFLDGRDAPTRLESTCGERLCVSPHHRQPSGRGDPYPVPKAPHPHRLDAAAVEIRRRFENGASHNQLAADYDTGIWTIRNLLAGRSRWALIEPDTINPRYWPAMHPDHTPTVYRPPEPAPDPNPEPEPAELDTRTPAVRDLIDQLR